MEFLALYIFMFKMGTHIIRKYILNLILKKVIYLIDNMSNI
ncbi:hypothetical protein ECHLIB_0456 [Ehrlichia chaffeensis str. Liberty]|nr:hypothetical protein ECHLIB_0456 [Ehrlichia chaffeensis str. Liberty]AHX08731.1 hypothetical protein ECHSTV_0444 [Ehrlichia chaffeensis str. Saint Vincent]